MQITDLRSIVTDVRRLTLQIINGCNARVRDVGSRRGINILLLILRFILQKLRNAFASVAEYGTRIVFAVRLFITLCARSLRRARSYFSNRS